MSLESAIAFRISEELYRRFPRLDPKNVGKKKDDEPSKIVESANAMASLAGLFEDDGKTGYLYVVDSMTSEPLAACWLYNRVPVTTRAEARACADRGEAPPLPREVQMFSISPPWKSVSPETIKVTWNYDESAVFVKHKKNVLGAIVRDGFSWKSYAVQLGLSCEWGDPMTKQIQVRYRIS